jgi:hypothetical protein
VARTVPVSASEAPGNFETAALWNAQVKAMIDWGTAVPRFLGYQTVAQSLPDSTNANAILLDSEDLDSDGGHSTTTNTSRYTVQVAGLYLMLGTVSINGNGTGGRSVVLTKNAASLRASCIQYTPPASFTWVGQAFTFAQCAVGDYLELNAWQQGTGTSISTNPSTKFGPGLSIYWLST